jgi:hypothetical protein
VEHSNHFNSINQDAIIDVIWELLNADTSDVPVDRGVKLRQLPNLIQGLLDLVDERLTPAGMLLIPDCGLLELVVSRRAEDNR